MKATKHRVLDIGIERFSSAFFLEPKYAALIPSTVLPTENVQKEAPVTFGEWLVKKHSTYAEWQGFEMPDMSGRYRDADGNIVIGPSKKVKESEHVEEVKVDDGKAASEAAAASV